MFVLLPSDPSRGNLRYYAEFTYKDMNCMLKYHSLGAALQARPGVVVSSVKGFVNGGGGAAVAALRQRQTYFPLD